MSYSNRIEIRAHRESWLCDTISIRVANFRNANGNQFVAVALPLVMEQKTEDQLCQEIPATMQLKPSEAQQFMDELWRVGIRPTEGSGSVGQMAATEKHLNDMRNLVFKKEIP